MRTRIRTGLAIAGLLALVGTLSGCACVDWCGGFWSIGWRGGCGPCGFGGGGFSPCR